MNELINYVERKNKIADLFGERHLDINSASDRQILREQVDCDLSPENLTMDGELSRSQVQQKYAYLTAVQEQLEQLERHETLHRLLGGK